MVNSDESMLSEDWYLASSNSDNSSSNSKQVKCLLCRKYRKSFYCQFCVYDGSFSNSTATGREITFNDKRNNLLQLKKLRKEHERKYYINSRLILYRETMYSQIRKTRITNEMLNLAVEEKIERKSFINNKLAKLKEKNEKLKNMLLLCYSRLEEMEHCIGKSREKIELFRVIQKEKKDKMRSIIKLRVHQLFRWIFPIYEVEPLKKEKTSLIKDLFAAINTNYVSNHWEYMDYSVECKYRIVAPTLPCRGNYLDYNVCDTQNEYGGTMGDSPKFSIRAGLTLTAQLVYILSFYLNIRLPYNMLPFNDFSSNNISEEQFKRRVARLDTNILYLCFFQNVEVPYLSSHKTIHNLLQLVKDKVIYLAGQGSIGAGVQQVTAIVQPLLNDLKAGDASESEDDSFAVEWEEIPTILPDVPNCPEIAAGSTLPSSPQISSTLSEEIVNSASSAWRIVASIFS